MKIERDGSKVKAEIQDPIGEGAPLFVFALDGVQELVVDLKAVTMINSIGVKYWILWTSRIPTNCQVMLINCPYVFVSQASMVVGFIPPIMKIQSFRMPYSCMECGEEEFVLATRGADYEYAAPPSPKKIQLPEGSICSKCKKGQMEPDFLVEKTFKFLN
jgi:hypothetical protein